MHSFGRFFHRLLPAFLLALLAVAGCRDYQPTTDPNPTVQTIKTIVTGRVVDDAGNSVANASVTLHGQTTTSDANGIFTFTDATVPSDRALVQAHASGYFTASRGFIPSQGVSTVRLTLANRPQAGSVSATSGGTVSVGNGASVVIPAGGVVRADGSPYSGTVRVMARAWQPGDADFNNCFPGDARARTTSGETALLVSLGFQNVELEDGAGNELKLGNGAKATLNYTIPSAMQSAAPNRIPMWYFDESAGLWIEEGEAVRQGNMYVGEVAHFTPWNCDWRGGFGQVCGRVKMCGEDPAGGITVNVGPVQTTTEADGTFCVEVAAGWSDAYDVYAVMGNGSVTSNHESVPTVPQGGTVNVDLDMTATAIVRGRLVDCNGQATAGVVRASWDGIVQTVIYTQDGGFSLGIPAGKNATISSFYKDVDVPAQIGCHRYDVGDLQMCNSTPTNDQVIDWSIQTSSGTPTTIQSGSGAGMNPGSAVLENDGTLKIVAQGGVNSTPVELRMYMKSVVAPGTFTLGSMADRGAAVFDMFGSGNTLRFSTDGDSVKSNGRDSIDYHATGTLTISSVTATAFEGSFTVEFRSWQESYIITGYVTGVRKP